MRLISPSKRKSSTALRSHPVWPLSGNILYWCCRPLPAGGTAGSYSRFRLGGAIDGFFTDAAFSPRCDESALYIAAVGDLNLSAMKSHWRLVILRLLQSGFGKLPVTKS